MNRRHFLTTTAASVAAASTSAPAFGQKDTRKFRVAVIGHTGRGNYGHGLDTIWLDLPGTEIVAVSDPDIPALTKAKKRLGADVAIGDYREMLPAVKPDIVAICPRHADQHRDMAIAAAETGTKGIYIEKPFCRTPAEADDIVAACKKSGTKLAIAHRNRYHPVLPVIDRLIADGKIGNVLEIRGRGKGDRRGGAEDLWVLGSHVLNLVHYFAGDPVSCFASLLQNGKPVTGKDVREGNEGLGSIAGNQLHARYEFQKGDETVTAYFDSIANDGTKNAGFGLQIIGSEGIISIQCDCDPLAHLCPGNPFDPNKTPRAWIPITTAGPGKPEPEPEKITAAQNHTTAAEDLIAAIKEGRPPLCDITQATTTVELICATFLSHSQGGKAVTFPLTNRQNALADLPT